MYQLIDSDKINLKPLITHVLPMEEYQKAFELAKCHEVLKVLAKPRIRKTSSADDCKRMPRANGLYTVLT